MRKTSCGARSRSRACGSRNRRAPKPYAAGVDAVDDFRTIELAQATPTSANWRAQLPVLHGRDVTIRQLRFADAQSLLAALTTDEVTRFISPPPTTVESFERFIAWTAREQAAGRYVCFGVVPSGCIGAVGIIQIRALEPDFGIAEWGFAIASEFWGTGVFQRSARAAIDFAIEVIGVRRLEARAAVPNGRGNAALRKLGAIQEAVLRKSFFRRGEYVDQILWAIVADEYRAAEDPARLCHLGSALRTH